MSDTGDRFRNQSFPTPRAIGERTVSGFAWSRIRGAMMTAIDIERSATTSRERDARIDAIAAKCESDILAVMLSTEPTPRETGADIDRMTCPKCGYGGSAMHHDPSGDNWRSCASCGADWDADPTPRPVAASASVTEAEPIAALRDLAHRLRGIRYADYSGELTRIADALAAGPWDAGREEVSEVLHDSVPEYAAGWEIGPEELNAASYWAHRYERLARAVAAARRGATA